MKLLLSSCVRFRSSLPIIGLIFASSMVLICMVLILHFWQGIPIAKLTRDPVSTFKAPFYIGLLSQVGIFFWSASVAVCMMSVQILSKYQDNRRIKRFLLVSGLLSLMLGLDDVFLLHEQVFPYLGIPEKLVYSSYAGFVLFHLVRFYSVILETEYILLGMSFFFFGVSITLDLLNIPGLDPHIFEDSAKLVGIVSWLSYFFRVGVFAICSSSFSQGTAPSIYPTMLHNRR